MHTLMSSKGESTKLRTIPAVPAASATWCSCMLSGSACVRGITSATGQMGDHDHDELRLGEHQCKDIQAMTTTDTRRRHRCPQCPKHTPDQPFHCC